MAAIDRSHLSKMFWFQYQATSNPESFNHRVTNLSIMARFAGLTPSGIKNSNSSVRFWAVPVKLWLWLEGWDWAYASPLIGCLPRFSEWIEFSWRIVNNHQVKFQVGYGGYSVTSCSDRIPNSSWRIKKEIQSRYPCSTLLYAVSTFKLESSSGQYPYLADQTELCNNSLLELDRLA